jgi:sporulation protein YabP
MEHNLTLTKRTELGLTGVKKVKSTEPRSIVAVLENGGIVVSGANLSVEQLDLKAGTMDIKGTVDAVKYTNKVAKSWSFKNMFK